MRRLLSTGPEGYQSRRRSFSPGESTVPGSEVITTVRSSKCLMGIWKPHRDSVSEIFFVMYRSCRHRVMRTDLLESIVCHIGGMSYVR